MKEWKMDKIRWKRKKKKVDEERWVRRDGWSVCQSVLSKTFISVAHLCYLLVAEVRKRLLFSNHSDVPFFVTLSAR